MMQPIESIDYLFIRSFCEEDIDFDSDLPLMIRDFLLHEQEKILDYSGFVYADDSFENSGALSGMRYKFLNILLAAARHGSDYAAEMLCRIYKIYYRKEYNQLKRFKTLSYSELTGFDNDEELFETISARILTIAPFMGINVSPECILAQDDIEEVLEDARFGFKTKPDWLEFKDGLFPKALEDSKELLSRFKKKRRDWYFDAQTQKFIRKVFNYHGVPSDFDLLCEPHFETDEREFAVTLAILRTTWPKRDFSDEEVEMFWGIYRAFTIFIEHLTCLDESVDLMLGRNDKFSFELSHSKYLQASNNKIEVPKYVSGDQKKNGGTPDQNRTSGSAQISSQGTASGDEDPYAEIERLRASLRAKDQTISQLDHLYHQAAEREKQNRIDHESMENDREELVKLREALYQLTEDDLITTSVSQDEMEKAVAQKKIVIVGGHDNWVAFLRQKFPDWIYIKPGIANTVPENAIKHADYLFFFTDTLSHGTYYKFLNTVRANQIPFGYLHGTNIPMTVQKVYESLHE